MKTFRFKDLSPFENVFLRKIMIRYNSELAYYNITGEGLVRAGGANVGPQVGIIFIDC